MDDPLAGCIVNAMMPTLIIKSKILKKKLKMGSRILDFGRDVGVSVEYDYLVVLQVRCR